MRTVVDKDGYHILLKDKAKNGDDVTASAEPVPSDVIRQQDQTSHNGHETHGQLAERNLRIKVAYLLEARWQIVNAFGNSSEELAIYDQGIERLQKVLASLCA